MGRYDSSKYRVTPLAKLIEGNQTAFDSFLKSVRSEKTIPQLTCPKFANAYFYGENEKQLNPPKDHLIAIIEHVFIKNFVKSASVKGKRADLYGLNGEDCRLKAKNEAIKLIEENYSNKILPKEWYIFEGATNPDLYIEGDDYVIVCEGKWTESHITTKTTHLSNRSQMARHIQGVINYTNKKVYAFYIVDKDCGYLNDLTEKAFKEQIKTETIKPKRIDDIISSFYGYTTWQDLEKAISNLNFLTKAQIDNLNN